MVGGWLQAAPAAHKAAWAPHCCRTWLQYNAGEAIGWIDEQKLTHNDRALVFRKNSRPGEGKRSAKSGFRQPRFSPTCTGQILGKLKQTQTAMQVGAAPLWPSKETCPRTCWDHEAIGGQPSNSWDNIGTASEKLSGRNFFRAFHSFSKISWHSFLSVSPDIGGLCCFKTCKTKFREGRRLVPLTMCRWIFLLASFDKVLLWGQGCYTVPSWTSSKWMLTGSSAVDASHQALTSNKDQLVFGGLL